MQADLKHFVKKCINDIYFLKICFVHWCKQSMGRNQTVRFSILLAIKSASCSLRRDYSLQSCRVQSASFQHGWPSTTSGSRWITVARTGSTIVTPLYTYPTRLWGWCPVKARWCSSSCPPTTWTRRYELSVQRSCSPHRSWCISSLTTRLAGKSFEPFTTSD